jgi:hypothetical protein
LECEGRLILYYQIFAPVICSKSAKSAQYLNILAGIRKKRGEERQMQPDPLNHLKIIFFFSRVGK